MQEIIIYFERVNTPEMKSRNPYSNPSHHNHSHKDITGIQKLVIIILFFFKHSLLKEIKDPHYRVGTLVGRDEV